MICQLLATQIVKLKKISETENNIHDHSQQLALQPHVDLTEPRKKVQNRSLKNPKS